MLTGQSNSNGAGTVLAEDKIPDTAPIVVLTPESGLRDSQEPWRVKGVGAGRSFAKYVLAHDTTITQIWMIACGVGGSGIQTWLPNAPNTHMTDCVNLAKRAESFGAKPGAILWMQGENDSGTLALAQMYGVREKNLILGFRSAVGVLDLPFLMSELPNNVPVGFMPYRDVVNQQAEDMLATLPNTAFIHTDDLKAMRTDEPVHWERGPQRAIGNRFGEALLSITPVLGGN
jgi:hypothetical protein